MTDFRQNNSPSGSRGLHRLTHTQRSGALLHKLSTSTSTRSHGVTFRGSIGTSYSVKIKIGAVIAKEGGADVGFRGCLKGNMAELGFPVRCIA